jgi:hypothetical protein
VRCDERLELGHERALAAERELDLDPILGRRKPELIEAVSLRPHERVELHVGKRPSAPERVRVAEHGGRTARIARGARGTAGVRQLLEAVCVELIGLDAQHVARGLRRKPAVAVRVAARRERFAQTRDLQSESVVRPAGRLLRPESIDQLVARDDPVGVQQ